MGGGGGPRNIGGNSSSSGEEDGDADWKAAIDSVAATTTFSRTTNIDLASTSKASKASPVDHAMKHDDDSEGSNHKLQNLKHYQIKAQSLLDDILEKSMEIVRDPINTLEDNPIITEGGVRLFKHAPPGILFDYTDELQRPTKKPRILPGKEIDENSEKFRWKIQSVAVEGMDIIAAARGACQRSLAKLEAREAAAKAATKEEEERVAELKKIRGERWLPSIARDMQVKLPSS
ncbi:hypothetical protein NMG60_11005974 [Bertholletia excelsa]